MADLLPQFDVETAHAIAIAAPPAVVYENARNLDLSGSAVARVLFALRCMPGTGLQIDGLRSTGFKLLRDEPGRGFVLGLIGQFWTLRGGLLDFQPADFGKLAAPGYAKAVWSFEAAGAGQRTILTTITRVQCQDAVSRRRFRRYWRVIGPFSGIIRRVALRTVREKSEAAAMAVPH